MLRRARWLYPALVCVLIVLYFEWPAARVVTASAAGAVCAGAVVWGAITHRPGSRTPWLLLAAAIVVLAAGEATYSALDTGGPVHEFPAIPDVFTFAAYPLLAMGLLWLGLSRAPSRDLNAAIDTAVLSLAGILVVWITLIRPTVVDLQLTELGKVIVIGTIVGDVVVVAGTARRMFVWRRSLSAFCLGGAVIGLLIADYLYGVELVDGTWSNGGPLDLGILVFFGLCGAAALVPSMTRLGTPPEVHHSFGAWRLAALAAALLVAPSVLLVEATPGPVRTPIAIAIVSATIGLLVIARLIVSVRGHQRTLDRERVVRRTSRRLGLATTASEVTAGLVDALSTMATGDPTDVRLAADARAARDRPDADPPVGLVVPVEDSSDPRAFRFVAPSADLAELYDVLIGLGEQAGTALHRIDLAARVQNSEMERHLLAYRASHDALTGLANAELFRDELRAVRRAADGVRVTAVLFVDLDDFKTINDSLGHEIGDGVLRICAERIRACLRRDDLGARLGGDEFAILLRGLTDADAARPVAARITAALAKPAQVSGIPVVCRASVGLAIARTADEHDAVLRRADTALYVAKASGKGNWQPYDESMHSPLRRTADLRTELDKALRPGPDGVRGGGLSLHYQPIVALATGAVSGFEALIRWDHPRYGAIPVTDLITVAEQTGMIVPLGDWVLTQALADAVRIAHAADGRRYVSVNVSAPQLREPGFTRRIRDQLADAGLDPSLLVLEITESQLVREDEPMWAELKVLRDLGVRVAIDDYGTGYASMSYLRHPIIDIVKLDQSFMANLDDPRPRTLLRAVLSLTGELGIDLIAEGIERSETRQVLSDLGCRYGQGHLFAAAMPIHEALRWPEPTVPSPR